MKDVPTLYRQYGPGIVLLTAATLLLSVPFHLKPDNFCVDDGYFYLQIARNIIQQHESTFNGWLPTNGYHPLWMVLCCLCASISSRSAILLQLAACLQDALLAVSIAILVFLVSRERMRGSVFGCILLWFTNDVLGIWRLLETDLALLLQLCVLLSVTPLNARPLKSSTVYDFRLGLLLGLMLLARLDLVFFAIVIILFEFSRREGKARFTSLLLQGSCMIATLIPYLTWNVVSFGHLMPISGAIKSTFPRPHLQFASFVSSSTLPVVFGLLFGVGMLFQRSRTRFQTVLMLTGIGGGIHLLYTSVFSSAWPWYFTTGYLAFSLSLIYLANLCLTWLRASEWLERSVLISVCLLFLLLAGIRSQTNLSFTRLLSTHTVRMTGKYTEPRRAFAELLRRNFAPGTRFLVFDSPGSTAFYSGMSVTPSDGLVGDYKWNDDVARTGISSYAKAHEINYFACPVLKAGQSYNWLSLTGVRLSETQAMHYMTPLGNRDGGNLSLRDQDLILTAQTIQPGFESTYPLVGVWRMP